MRGVLPRYELTKQTLIDIRLSAFTPDGTTTTHPFDVFQKLPIPATPERFDKYLAPIQLASPKTSEIVRQVGVMVFYSHLGEVI